MLAPSSPSLPVTHLAPFAIEGRSEGFSSLANAIAAAVEGDIITVRAPGPFLMPPLSWNGKALTLRAAEGTRPRLELTACAEPWQGLLQTDRALTLEGLELAEVSAQSPQRSRTPLIRCTHSSLYLTNCRLQSKSDGATLVVRNPRAIIVRGCDIESGAVGFAIEVGQTDSACIRIENTRLSVCDAAGIALSLWAVELRQATPIELELNGNTIECGRLAALRDLPASLHITARDNRFHYRTALLSYSGFAERDAWRDTVWQGEDNSYRGPASWLWVEDKPIVPGRDHPAMDVAGSS